MGTEYPTIVRRYLAAFIDWSFIMVTFVFSSSLPLLGAESEDVSANIVSSGIVITNNTQMDVYYAVHEETILAAIEWAPICTNENLIPPKKSIRVAVTFVPSGKVHVFWWHKGKYLMDHDHYGPDKVRSFVLEKE